MIDVVCANYNNGPFLAEFFDSLIDSSLLPSRLIFIDDCSTDNSLAVCSEYSSKIEFLEVIKLERNVGFANALNIGFSLATGKYIVRIDPDDIFSRDRIDEQFQFMEENSSVDVVGSQAQYFHSRENKFLGFTRMPKEIKDIHAAYLDCDNGLLHGTTFIRRASVKEIVYRQDDVPSEDYSFFARMLLSGCTFSNIDKPLTFVRIHEGSVSNDIHYSTINKVHLLRQEIFNVKRSAVAAYINYIGVKYYRKFLFSERFFHKCIYLFVAAAAAPKKSFRRVLEMFKWKILKQ
jgi:glycosyltransferase involved in cell wall biosynthesis